MADALAGIVVIEEAESVAAAVCGMILADLGAHVTKLHRPGAGRSAMVDRGKTFQEIAVDSPEGRAMQTQLVRQADVYVTDRPITPDEPPSTSGQIWCAITPFGSTGPDRDRPATEGTLQALSGVMSITGEPGRPPVRVGFSVARIYAGLHAAIAVLAALYKRMESGRGQTIDLSCTESLISLWATNGAQFLANGPAPGPFGNENPNRCPAKTFAAADGGYFHIMAANDAHWPRFCEAMGWNELATDPELSSNRRRVANREAVNRLIAEAVVKEPRQVWLDKLERAGVPTAPVNTLADLLEDPHYQARQMLLQEGGGLHFGSPLRMSATPGRPRPR